MTVSTTAVSVSYAGNGVTVAFPIPFSFGAAADLVVVLVDDATGAETTQALTTHYTVARSANGTGTLTMLAAPATGKTLLISRETALTQPDSLRNQGAYYPETVERMVDRVVRQVQDVSVRAMRLPDASLGSVSAVLPAPAPLNTLTWSADGERLVNRPLADTGAAFTQAGEGAVARTVQGKFEEEVSVKDFGAVGNGIADDTPKIQAAINAMAAAGGGIVKLPQGTYQLMTPLVGKSSVTLRGAGAKAKLRIGALTYAFLTEGTLSTDLTNTLAANATIGATTFTLTAGKGANFIAGDYCLLSSEAAMPQGACTNKRGEFVRVQSVVGDLVTVESPLVYAYNTADTARLRKITTVNDFAIEDLTIDGNYLANSATFRRSQSIFSWCLRPRITRVRFRDMGQQAISFGGCLGWIVESCQFDDLASNDASEFGYAVHESALNVGGRMNNCTGERVRHMFTTTDASTPFAPGYGQAMGTRIIGCTALWPRAAGFDTHESGLDVSFTGCTVIGGQRAGFQARSLRTSINDCVVSDCVGESVYVDSSAEDTVITNLRGLRTNTGTYLAADRRDRGAVFDNGKRTRVTDCRIELCGGPAIEGYTGATGFSYERNLIRNPCQLAATNPYSIFVNTAAAINVDIHHNRITATDGKTAEGIRATSGNTKGFVTGNNVRGVATPFNFGASIQATGNLPADFQSVGQVITKTIAAGAIDVSDVNSGLVSLLGEGGLADDLATITGGVTGQKITFKRGAAVNITVKNGTGNIQLKAATDHVLGSSFANVVLRKDSSTWVEDGI